MRERKRERIFQEWRRDRKQVRKGEERKKKRVSF